MGPLVTVCPPSGASGLRDRWEAPSDSCSPSRGGVPCCSAGRSHPVLCCAPWVRTSGWGLSLPLPPLAAARVRRGQPFGGVPSPPSLRRLFPLAPRLPSWGFPSSPSSSGRPALWVVAPWLSSPAAGPALALPLANASKATLSYSRRVCMSFSFVVPAAPEKCLGGYSAPPATAAVHPLPPPARARFAHTAGAEEPLPCPGPCCSGGSCAGAIAPPPRAPAVRRGRALLGGGSPSPLPLSAAACVRRG